jgi:hypothetical protein
VEFLGVQEDIWLRVMDLVAQRRTTDFSGFLKVLTWAVLCD